MNVIRSQLVSSRGAFILENCCNAARHAVHQSMTDWFIDLSAPNYLDALLQVTGIAELPIVQLRPDNCHRFSIEWRSGKYPDHSRTWIWYLWNQEVTAQAVWQEALSCWSTLASQMSMKREDSFSSRTSMYLAAFILEWIRRKVRVSLQW